MLRLFSRCRTRIDDTDFRRRWFLVIRRFDDKVYWWELVLLVRKALLAFAVVLMPSTINKLQMTLTILLTFYLLQVNIVLRI